MSTRKKKTPDLESVYKSLTDLLTKIKADLQAAFSERTVGETQHLVHNLQRIGALAEQFTSLQQRGNQSDASTQTDALDREGVNLWNLTGMVRKSSGSNNLPLLVASIKFAAFRLIEAGLESEPSIESLANVLQLASKTGSSLSESGATELAGTVLTSAAKFEDTLKNMNDPDNSHQQAKASASAVYFASRMEAAWKEGNASLAEYMASRITDDERLSLLPPHQRELLATKICIIGRACMSSTEQGLQKENAENAVGWLQKALSVTDRMGPSTNDSVENLKISILRTLARAFFFSEAYDKAEATLEELIPSIDRSQGKAASEHQELRWLRLAVLKRRRSGEATLLDALQSIVANMELTEINVMDVLRDLRSTNHTRTLVTAVHRAILARTFSQSQIPPEIVDCVLLSLIVHCSKDDDHAATIRVMEETCSTIVEANYLLRPSSISACLTLIWRYATAHYNGKRFPNAADWFLLGTKAVFAGEPSGSNGSIASKCYRKAALCYIEQKEYAKASTVMRKCETNEATNSYVTFLSAVHQGLEDEAIRAVHTMVKAPDFKRKMLLLATQISHESEMKPVLLTVLQALLSSLKQESSLEGGDNGIVEAMALIRCILRLALRLINEPTANRSVLVEIIVKHSQAGLEYAEAAVKRNCINLIMKDVQWLWRTAYNFAIDHCSSEDTEDVTVRTRQTFEISRKMIECCLQGSVGEVDPELWVHWVNSAFSAVAGQVFALRQAVPDDREGASQRPMVLSEIENTKARVLEILRKNTLPSSEDSQRIQYFLHVLRVFQAEILAHEKDWDGLLKSVKEIVSSDPMAASTFEAMGDILWEEKDCPINVLHTCLEALLHATLDQSSISVEKFSRWLRAICTIGLARNNPEDRLKAIGYIEQAVDVMKSNLNGENAYPMDEKMWLLSSAYNTGYECLKASILDEAKRWFEISTAICKYIDNGEDYADKISQAYMHSLELHARNIEPHVELSG